MRRVAVGILLLIQARNARAGNEDTFLFGDQAALTGGAVVASIRDTAAIWYNPAGLAHNQRGRLEISGTAFTLRIRNIPGGLALDLPSGRAEESIESTQISVTPTAIALARAFSPRLSAGIGLFVSEQDISNFKRGARESDARTSLDVAGALRGAVIRYQAGPALGWRATPWLRLGVALLGVYEERNEFRKLFANAQMTGGAYQTTFLERLVDTEITRLGLELVAGLQLDAGPWQLGLSARAPRLIVSEDAATDNSTSLISKGTNAPTVAESAVDHAPIGAEGTGLTHPPRLIGGAARRLGACELSVEIELRPSGVGETAHDWVVNARSGLLWPLGDATLLGIGLFSDRSGAGRPATFPEARVDYYGVSLGWKRRTRVRLHAAESTSTLFFSTTAAARYAVGLGESARIRFDFRDTSDTGSVGRVADELVDVTYHELSIYLGTGLEF